MKSNLQISLIHLHSGLKLCVMKEGPELSSILLHVPSQRLRAVRKRFQAAQTSPFLMNSSISSQLSSAIELLHTKICLISHE